MSAMLLMMAGTMMTACSSDDDVDFIKVDFQLQNEDGIVTTLMTRDDFYSAKSEQIIEDSYEGSLPAFIAAFTSRKKLSNAEVDEIQKMIDEFRKGKK